MKILSQAVIDQLIQDTSLELLPVMLNSFIEELDRRSIAFEEVSQSWSPELLTPLRDAAHALKSCSGTFGAELLHEHSKQLEDALRAELTAPIPGYISEVREAIQLTQEKYRAYRDQLN